MFLLYFTPHFNSIENCSIQVYYLWCIDVLCLLLRSRESTYYALHLDMPGAFGVRVIYMKPIVPYAVCTLCLLSFRPLAQNRML